MSGRVKTRALTIFLPIPGLTALAWQTEPTPRIAPVMVWVVHTGAPIVAAIESQVTNLAFYHQSRAVSARNYRGDTPRL